MPTNNFKKKLGSGQTQFGLWCSFPSSFATEVVAGAGYDWLLFDTEHSPGDPITVLPQLQAAAAYPDVSALVRPASNDPVLIKRFLDIGAQTLLVPFVQTVDETELAVQASRYAPNGFRGVSALTRATRFDVKRVISTGQAMTSALSFRSRLKPASIVLMRSPVSMVLTRSS